MLPFSWSPGVSNRPTLADFAAIEIAHIEVSMTPQLMQQRPSVVFLAELSDLAFALLA